LLAKNGDVDSFIDSKQGGPAHLLRQPILHSLTRSRIVERFETETKTERTTSWSEEKSEAKISEAVVRSWYSAGVLVACGDENSC
jgi:hypothetical protein